MLGNGMTGQKWTSIFYSPFIIFAFSRSSRKQRLQNIKSLLQSPLRGLFYCIIEEYTNEVSSSMTYKLTDAEDAILVECLSFVQDMGIPDHLDQDAFDSLWEKVFASN